MNNTELIAEAQRILNDPYALVASAAGDLLPQLTDALEASVEAERDAERRFTAMLDVEASLRRDLEASEAQVARLRASIKACDGICECHLDERYPPELLASVREYDILHKDVCVDECKARATLRRYGLLLEERCSYWHHQFHGWHRPCLTCGRHCPAAPMEDAPTAQVVTKESRPDVWAKLQPPDVPLATLDAWDHAGRRPGEDESANRAP